MLLKVTDDGTRVAGGSPDKCFYCGSEPGKHRPECTLFEKAIIIETTIRQVVSVPRAWDTDAIEFFYNQSSLCANNILDELGVEVKDDCPNCICPYAETKYIKDYEHGDHPRLPGKYDPEVL